MTVSATSPIDNTAAAAGAAAAGAASTGRTRLAESFDMFLTLLTTQMKNQDPTAPMDSNQFMAQLVQMTGVEQQLAANELLEQLVANTGSTLASVVDLIGKEVRADTSETALANGQAKWGYSLDADAADVKIEVLDSQGVPVRILAAGEADRTAGDHAFVWDGKDGTGASLPDGVYTLRITAKDSAGTQLISRTFVEGLVTGVENRDGQGLITVNGAKVAMGQVTSVSLPAANSNTTASGDGASAAGADSTINPADQTSAQTA